MKMGLRSCRSSLARCPRLRSHAVVRPHSVLRLPEAVRFPQHGAFALAFPLFIAQIWQYNVYFFFVESFSDAKTRSSAHLYLYTAFLAFLSLSRIYHQILVCLIVRWMNVGSTCRPRASGGLASPGPPVWQVGGAPPPRCPAHSPHS